MQTKEKGNSSLKDLHVVIARPYSSYTQASCHFKRDLTNAYTWTSMKSDFDTPAQRRSGKSFLDPPLLFLITLLPTCPYSYKRAILRI